MPSERARILVFKHPSMPSPSSSEGILVESGASIPAGGRFPSGDWDYLHLAVDARILDERIYSIAAEYAGERKPDMIVLSSPDRRFLTGVYDRPARIFEALCHLARQNALYAFGNKLFSRTLWAAVAEREPGERLSEALMRLRRLIVLSHPWTEFAPAENPDDAAFFRLVDHYAGAPGGEGGL